MCEHCLMYGRHIRGCPDEPEQPTQEQLEDLEAQAEWEQDMKDQEGY